MIPNDTDFDPDIMNQKESISFKFLMSIDDNFGYVFIGIKNLFLLEGIIAMIVYVNNCFNLSRSSKI